MGEWMGDKNGRGSPNHGQCTTEPAGDKQDVLCPTCKQRRCTGTNRDGTRCKQYSLRGARTCRMHGSATPQTRAKVAREQEQERAELELAKAAVTYGLSREVDPHRALMEEIHRTAGHVDYLAGVVAQLERDALVRGITRTVTLPDGSRRIEAESAVNVWVKLYQTERDHLRRVCADAIRCGVEERRVELEAQTAQLLASKVRAIVTDLGHDLTDPTVRRVVRFRLVEGGDAA